MSEAWVGESGSTPNRWFASFVSRPRTRVRASLVNHVGSRSLVCAILRWSSFCSLCHHGASPVIISKSSTPKAHTSTAWPHCTRRRISGAMYSVVPTRTALPEAEMCVAGAVRPKAARPKSQSLMLPSAQMRTFSGLRSR